MNLTYKILPEMQYNTIIFRKKPRILKLKLNSDVRSQFFSGYVSSFHLLSFVYPCKWICCATCKEFNKVLELEFSL